MILVAIRRWIRNLVTEQKADQESGTGVANASRAWRIEFLSPIVVISVGILATLLLAHVLSHMFLPRDPLAIGISKALAALALIFMIWVLIWRRLAMSYMPRRGAVIRADIEYTHSINLSDAFYVGASPQEFRIDITWDTGYLTIGHGSMRYYGERASFELAPGQVQEIRVMSKWWQWWSYPYLQIVWRETPNALIECFSVAVHDVGSSGSIHVRTMALMARMESWRSAGMGAVSTQNALGLPRAAAYAANHTSPLSIPRIPAFLSVLTHQTGMWSMACLILMICSVHEGSIGYPTHTPISHDVMFLGLLFLMQMAVFTSWMKNRD